MLETGNVLLGSWVTHGAEVEARLASWRGVFERMLGSGVRTRPLESGFEFRIEIGKGLGVEFWSQLNSDPNRKCWTTGNFESTSALYILTIP